MKKITTLILAITISISLSSQCAEDQHSTSWFDAWVGCSPSINPNPIRGNSYWIQYDLGSTYTLDDTRFWNINDPSHKNYGLKNIIIDYSTDGVNWTEWGVHYLPQGSGLPSYEGVTGPDLGGIEAKYVLITAIDNWGGSCYGLSELKINVGSATSTPTVGIACLNAIIFPNPITSSSAMLVSSTCNGDVNFTIMDAVGTIVASASLGDIHFKKKVALPVEDLAPGVYLVTIYQNGGYYTEQIVII